MSGTAKAFVIFLVILAAFSGVCYLGISAISRGPAPATSLPTGSANPEQRADAGRQRGAYLMTVLACNDCHSPHDAKGQILAGKTLSGHPADSPLPEWDPSLMQRNAAATISPTFTAFAGPFGVSVAPNLTPDKETGIGNMTADDLIRSWKSGLHWKENRPILPPMPASGYIALTEDDVRALHAYLMSVPPVKNKAPSSRPAPSPPPG